MAKFSLGQLLLTGGAVILTVVLFLAPREGSRKQVTEKAPVEESFAINTLVDNAKKQIPKTALSEIAAIEANTGKGEDTEELLKLAGIWDNLKHYTIAADYYLKVAGISQQVEHLMQAGNACIKALRQENQTHERGFLSENAEKCFSAILKNEPENLDAKTGLGIIFVEESNNPMKGITLLREVVEKNPEHETAQLSLGFFSIRSNQYDKAVERFSKVLELNPSRIDVYLYLGEAMLAKGDSAKAENHFRTFRSLSADPEINRDVDRQIEQLNRKK
jgi:tetratricopeptide (TPR) repeat protein